MHPVGYSCTSRCVVEGFRVPLKHPGAGRTGGTCGMHRGMRGIASTPSRNGMLGVLGTGLDTHKLNTVERKERFV